MISNWSKLLTMMLALALLTACERGTRDLEQWVAETLRTPGGEIDPIPPVVAPERVNYVAFDLRDPFQRRVAQVDDPVEETGRVGTVRPDPDRRREFLENFPLDTLRMVGTLEFEGTPFALIRDNNNVVHRVAEGNHMGSNHGRIARVARDRVELIELVEDPRGGWMERRTQVVMAEN